MNSWQLALVYVHVGYREIFVLDRVCFSVKYQAKKYINKRKYNIIEVVKNYLF